MDHRWRIDGVSTEEEGRMRGLGTELQRRYNVLESETKGQKIMNNSAARLINVKIKVRLMSKLMLCDS